MSDFFGDILNQTAVYWAPSGVDATGNTTFAAAVEIAPSDTQDGCRWEHSFQTNTGNAGEENEPKQQLWYNASERTLLKDGRVYEGPLSDLTAPQQADPTLIKDVGTIKSIEYVPDTDDEDKLGRAICDGR